MSKPSRVDPERLAALMEGKLSASEAAVVRAELAASDPDLIESFADAAAVATELGMVTDATALSTPRRRRSIYGWSALAALAAAALIFVVVRGNGSRNEGFSVNGLIAALPMTVSAPPNDAWPAVRGASDDLAPTVRAARIGATMVDFELARRTGDTLNVRRRAATIAALGGGLPGGGPLVVQYRGLVSRDAIPLSTDTTRDRFNDALAGLAGRDWVTAGAAAETVRAAAESGDRPALTALCVRSGELERKLSIPLSPPGAGIRDSLTHALAERPCSLERVGTLSSELLAAITR